MPPYSTFDQAEIRHGRNRRQASTLTVLLTATAFSMAVVVGVVAMARGNLFGRARTVELVSMKNVRHARAVAQPRRLQKLMPLEVSRDIQDVYAGHEGDTEERAEMKDKFASTDMSARDKEKQKELHRRMDFAYDAGTVAPLGSAGGVTAARSIGPAGSEDVAWYGNWWSSMRSDEVLSGLEHMTGLRNIPDGKNKLVDAGINVDGWEPGRNTSEVQSDEASGNEVPAGFWTVEGKKAHEADVDIHHPCGSALRKRPCPEDQEIKDPVDLSKEPFDRRQVPEAWSPITGVKEPLWVDPVPNDELEDNHKAIEQAQLQAAHEKIEEARKQAEYDRKMKGDLAEEEDEKKEGAEKKEESAAEKKEEAPAAEAEAAAK